MTEIKHHLLGEPAVDHLRILATDAPGSGGAYHEYQIVDADPTTVREWPLVEIEFQNGTTKEAGVNGVTIEALLAIGMHRLECFQAGPFASADNAEALEHMAKAMACLQRRTRSRLARGVEGTLQV